MSGSTCFPREIWRIIFMFAGPFSAQIVRLVCKHWKDIVNSREFRELVEANPQCFIPARWHPCAEEFPLNEKTLQFRPELVHFLPRTYCVGGSGSDCNMPGYIAIEMDKAHSEQSLDAFFPNVQIKTLTEPESIWNVKTADMTKMDSDSIKIVQTAKSK